MIPEKSPRTEALEALAREAGLWNLFLPELADGPDFAKFKCAPC